MIIYEEEMGEYEEDATTWIALADMMTGLMAIFLALSIAILMMQQSKRDAIVLSVSENLQKILEQEGISANIDPKTGRLMVSTDTTFDMGQSVLNAQGKEDLNIIMPVYAKAIFGTLTPEQRDSIDRIIIEGHTDKVGNYANNMKLSTDRANAILYHVYDMPEFQYKSELLHKLTAVGRGENDAMGVDEVANPSDRRVVIRFEFKEGDEQNSHIKNTQDTTQKIEQLSN